MGCGISSRFESGEDHVLERRSSIGEDQYSTSKTTNTRGSSRLLFSNNNGGDDLDRDCRRSTAVSSSSSPSKNSASPVHNSKRIPKMPSLTLRHGRRGNHHHRLKVNIVRGSQIQSSPSTTDQAAGNIVEARNCSDDAAGDRKDLEREININSQCDHHRRDYGEKEEDGDYHKRRISNSNLEENNGGGSGRGGGGSPLNVGIGSPSFREYCRSDGNLYGINDAKEKEEMMSKEDNIKASNDQGLSGSGSSVAGAVAVKKTRTRRFRKVPTMHKPPAAVRNLMRVASCYHPRNHNHNHNHNHNVVSS